MQPETYILSLERTAQTLATLLTGVPSDQARWRPAPGQWSILEVAGHLLDEERQDFRPRLRRLLERASDLGPPIDPHAWVLERRYNDQDLAETLRSFQEERARSLAWLRGLESPTLDHAIVHSQIGTLHAGDLLASWAAHDLLHIRQLTRLHYLYANLLAAPFGTAYAGNF